MPCDYSKYPEKWFTEIRPAILKRANNKCEFCGVKNYSVKSTVISDFHVLFNSYKEALEFKRSCIDSKVVVLTIAHLDHNLANNDPSNLKALCQRCHNRHDAKHRAEVRNSNRRFERIAND